MTTQTQRLGQASWDKVNYPSVMGKAEREAEAFTKLIFNLQFID